MKMSKKTLKRLQVHTNVSDRLVQKLLMKKTSLSMLVVVEDSPKEAQLPIGSCLNLLEQGKEVVQRRQERDRIVHWKEVGGIPLVKAKGTPRVHH